MTSNSSINIVDHEISPGGTDTSRLGQVGYTNVDSGATATTSTGLGHRSRTHYPGRQLPPRPSPRPSPEPVVEEHEAPSGQAQDQVPNQSRRSPPIPTSRGSPTPGPTSSVRVLTCTGEGGVPHQQIFITSNGSGTVMHHSHSTMSEDFKDLDMGMGKDYPSEESGLVTNLSGNISGKTISNVGNFYDSTSVRVVSGDFGGFGRGHGYGHGYGWKEHGYGYGYGYGRESSKR